MSADADRSLWQSYLALGALLMAAVGVPVLLRVGRHCFHSYDLGIYAQAAYLIDLGNLNPWLSTLGLKIFNDHFDPILLVAAPLAKLWDPAHAMVVLELALVLASPLPILWLYRKGKVSRSTALLLIALLLFNRGTIRALSFPVHPTTWAMLPMVLLCALVIGSARGRSVLLAAGLLLLFREEFPFAVMALGLGYVLSRRYRLGAALVLGAALWAVGAFFVRPALLGPVAGFGPGLLAGFLADPGGTFGVYLADTQLIRRLGELMLLLVPLAVWLFRSGQRPNGYVLCLLAPLLAIRILGHAWYFHYLAPVMASAVLLLAPLGARVRPPRWVVVSTVAMLLAFNGGTIVKAARTYVDTDQRCPGAPQRLQAIRECHDYLSRNPQGAAGLQGNLVPGLVRRGEIYPLGKSGPAAKQTFRFVLVEKPPAGDPWPIGHRRYATLIEEWRTLPTTHVLRDDSSVFFAEGVFESN